MSVRLQSNGGNEYKRPILNVQCSILKFNAVYAAEQGAQRPKAKDWHITEVDVKQI